MSTPDENGWFDIATAPDGEFRVWTYHPKGGVRLVAAEGGWWRSKRCPGPPTHWQPFFKPKPPASQPQEERVK